MRIDKFICDSINITRTQAKNKISKGCVYVDGIRVRSASLQVDEKHCTVTLDGTPVTYSKYVYIMMNKPAGVLSASVDKHTKTAIDLLNDVDKRQDLFIAGRLDKNTTGLLLITNNGEFAHMILSPKKHIFKTYLVQLKNDVDDTYTQKFEQGIVLEDGYLCKSARYKYLTPNTCQLEIREGKFHQIKRMFASLGNEVVGLKRIAMGDLTLDESLKLGEYRYLSECEIKNFVNKIYKNEG